MPIELKMPALSPTMEEGTLAKWLVKEGDSVAAGDLLAEIETDKATMEFEAVDEGTITKILVKEGSDAVKVGTVIALIAGEGENVKNTASKAADKVGVGHKGVPATYASASIPQPAPVSMPAPVLKERDGDRDRVKASPLARRLSKRKGVNLAALAGSGPGGRIVKADVDGAISGPAMSPALVDTEIPHERIKLSNMRKTIARRLTESKQQVPHIYLTVDIVLDALLTMRSEINTSLASRGIKLSVNDLLIKALAIALIEVPECNVSLSGSHLLKYSRADISVAVSIPGGLVTPIIAGADSKSVSTIATEMKELASRAREGKLQPHEYQGGTASLSNMGMYSIKQFDAVINPPQGMIMAIGAGEKCPWVIDGALSIATVMSATGSFDHRAIDGADGARLMQAFKRLMENPLGMLV